MKTVWAKSLEKMWDEDKKSIKRMFPVPEVNFKPGLPTFDAPKSVSRWSEYRMHQQAGGIVDVDKYLERRRNELEGKVADFYGVTVDPIALEVKNYEEYRAEYARLDAQYGRATGFPRPKAEKTPRNVLFPQSRIGIMAARHYCAFNPMDLRQKSQVWAYKFSSEAIDVMFCEMSLFAGFCDVRGESNEGLAVAWKVKGREQMEYVSKLAKVMTIIGLEHAIGGRDRELLGELMANKVKCVWSSDEQRLLYQGLDALVEAEGTLAAARQTPIFRPTGEVHDDMVKLEVREYEGESK